MIKGVIVLGMLCLGAIAAAAYTSHSASVVDGVIYWPAYHARQGVLKESLKDPESAQFRKLYFSKVRGLQYLCGEVNARNGMGGYNGYKPFYAASAYAVLGDDHDTSSLADIIAKCSGTVD